MKKIFGAFSVIASLAVGAAVFSSGCAGVRAHRSAGTQIDDPAIRTRVKVDLLGDPEVKGIAINVEVQQGNIRISGFVDSAAQKSRAGEIAGRVRGVRSVRNDLIVK